MMTTIQKFAGSLNAYQMNLLHKLNENFFEEVNAAKAEVVCGDRECRIVSGSTEEVEAACTKLGIDTNNL